jgi:putative DNA methylase
MGNLPAIDRGCRLFDRHYMSGADRACRKSKENKNAVATSAVMACRPRAHASESISRIEFIRASRRKLPAALKEMHRANIAPVDIPQASTGPGIAIVSRYGSVIERDDKRRR